MPLLFWWRWTSSTPQHWHRQGRKLTSCEIVVRNAWWQDMWRGECHISDGVVCVTTSSDVSRERRPPQRSRESRLASCRPRLLWGLSRQETWDVVTQIIIKSVRDSPAPLSIWHSQGGHLVSVSWCLVANYTVPTLANYTLSISG